MKHITHTNLQSFCRTCLCDLSDQSVILGEKYDVNDSENLSKWIHTCTSMDVNKSDDYPKYVCQHCYQKLQDFHEFRWTSVRAMRILTDIIKKKDLNIIMHMENICDSGCDSEEQMRDDQECVLEEIYGNTDWLEFNYDSTTESLEKTVKKTLSASKAWPYNQFANHNSDCEDNDVNFQAEANINVDWVDDAEGDIVESIDVRIQPIETLPSDVKKYSSTAKDGLDSQKPRDKLKSKKKAVRTITQKRSGTLLEKNGKKALPKNISTSKQVGAKFQCDRCSRRCVTRENLEAHIRTHQGLKPFLCKTCGRSFNRACHLRDHEREIHTSEQLEIVCSYTGCGKVFRREASYKVHYRLKHMPSCNQREPKTYVCEDCGRTFKNITILKEHRFKHVPQEEYPFKCNDCGKHYRSQRSYKEHQLRHAGIKNFVCPYCGMKKTTRNELRTHINYHTKERTWSCPLCPSVFNSSANLGLHDRVVHKGIRKYACRYCDQSFGKPDTLKHHEMRHTGEKPHACNICNKRFIQLVALRTHAKTHNKNDKPPEDDQEDCQDNSTAIADLNQELVTLINPSN